MEAFDTFVTEFFFSGGPDIGIVLFLVFDEVPEDADQFMSHGSDGFWGT